MLWLFYSNLISGSASGMLHLLWYYWTPHILTCHVVATLKREQQNCTQASMRYCFVVFFPSVRVNHFNLTQLWRTIVWHHIDIYSIHTVNLCLPRLQIAVICHSRYIIGLYTYDLHVFALSLEKRVRDRFLFDNLKNKWQCNINCGKNESKNTTG